MTQRQCEIRIIGDGVVNSEKRLRVHEGFDEEKEEEEDQVGGVDIDEKNSKKTSLEEVAVVAVLTEGNNTAQETDPDLDAAAAAARLEIEPPPPPDGGFGWVQVGVSFVINAFTWGQTAVS